MHIESKDATMKNQGRSTGVQDEFTAITKLEPTTSTESTNLEKSLKTADSSKCREPADNLEELRYSPPPPYNTEYHRSYRRSSGVDSDRIELRIRCPNLSSLRWCLKLYCLVLGGLGTLLSFLWVVFHLYVLGETDSIDLRLQRYLDIGLGCVLICSAAGLLYGGYAESRHWLVVYTTGSMCVLILYWSWLLYSSYVHLEQPVYSEEIERLLMFLSFIYILLLIPVLVYYKSLLQQNSSTPGRAHNCCEEIKEKSSSRLEKV